MNDFLLNWSLSSIDGLVVIDVSPCWWPAEVRISRLYVPELRLWFNSWADLRMCLSYRRHEL